jgi:hypothetical protein
VIHPSIGNFKWSNKKYTIEGLNAEYKLSEPKNRSWAPKSVWYFKTSKKKFTFGGQNAENAFRAQKLNLGSKISMVV